MDLVQYGTPHGYTAMAQCVGIPTALAARLVLDGTCVTLFMDTRIHV